MDSYNILILSTGRRVELVKCFKETIQKMKINSKIVGVDASNMAPALYFCDTFYQIPKIKEEGYLNKIIDIAQRENIALIIPTIDTELEILAENKEKIEKLAKTKLMLSSYDVVKICCDKIKTQNFLEKNGFSMPEMIREEQIKDKQYSFPLFIKPKEGSSSINAFKVKNDEELNFFMKYIKNPIVQKFAFGEEYTVDVFCDFDGNPITIVPRLRIETRQGEIAKGKIIKDRLIIDNIKKLIAVLKPIGHITIQCKKVNNKIKYIEINPRFGGGAPMSIRAGANSCENLYRILKGEKLSYNENYRDEIMFLRFDDSIMLNEKMEKTDV